MIIKNVCVGCVVEYAENKLLLTGIEENYIIKDWQVVNVICDPGSDNFSYMALPLPGFDEKTFPLIALCETEKISILNINSDTVKPLIKQSLGY